MVRSLKKGPYVDPRLLEKVNKIEELGKSGSVIKTWSRRSDIHPSFVGHCLGIHNGRSFKNVMITESMVGHKLGEFSPTRTFRSHGKVTKRVSEKT